MSDTTQRLLAHARAYLAAVRSPDKRGTVRNIEEPDCWPDRLTQADRKHLAAAAAAINAALIELGRESECVTV